MAGSTVCAVTSDGAGIRPNIKTERDTIILRDIPADTEMKDISEIFAGYGLYAFDVTRGYDLTRGARPVPRRVR